MGIINDYVRAVISLIRVLPKMNKEKREEIRRIVGALGDELERSIEMCQVYLNGAIQISNKEEFVHYLQNAPKKLSNAFKEYRICSHLHELNDRMEQVFNSTKLAVRLGKVSTINELLSHLQYGERSIIDDVDELLRSIDNILIELSNAPKNQVEGIMNEAKLLIIDGKNDLWAKKMKLKETVRIVFDSV